jgi:hypothetical protein
VRNLLSCPFLESLERDLLTPLIEKEETLHFVQGDRGVKEIPFNFVPRGDK